MNRFCQLSSIMPTLCPGNKTTPQDHAATFKLIPGFDPGPIPEKGRTRQQNNSATCFLRQLGNTIQDNLAINTFIQSQLTLNR